MESHWLSKWKNILLWSFLIVVLFGVFMRVKIIWEVPFLVQKNLQHAHSHFAFSGWMSQWIMVYMIDFIQKKNPVANYQNKFQLLLYTHWGISIAMLISFTIWGYQLPSILISTISIFFTYLFAYWVWLELKKIPTYQYPKVWYQSALFFLVISSFGTFVLAWMMATKSITQDWYLSSIYYYLHFQYNGWFWFGISGILAEKIRDTPTNKKLNTWASQCFIWSCIPTFLLSLLWLQLPVWLMIICVLGTILQTIGILIWLKLIWKSWKNQLSNILPNWIFWLVGLAILTKYVLQLLSNFPEISHMAFGFRNVVIAYLHLILLTTYSVITLIELLKQDLSYKIIVKYTLIFILVGIVINQLLLGIHGIFSIDYRLIPNIHWYLFFASVWILAGSVWLNFSFFRKKS